MKHDPLPVFVSYASYDNQSENTEERWLDRLLQFLKPLNLDNSISTWADTELKVGEAWKVEINKAIEKARVAILLVSPAFLASEFINKIELPKILRNANPTTDGGNQKTKISEGMLVLPVVIRPCLIEQVRFEVKSDTSEVNYARLSDFQYVPEKKAMNGLDQFEQDMQFQQVAMRIMDVLVEKDAEIPVKISKEGLEELKSKLTEFLKEFDRWWFNALRIQLWGSKQAGFDLFGAYTVRQLTQALNELVEQKIIDRKDGKKSLVYKAKK